MGLACASLYSLASYRGGVSQLLHNLEFFLDFVVDRSSIFNYGGFKIEDGENSEVQTQEVGLKEPVHLYHPSDRVASVLPLPFGL